jgi:polyribonucleotide nucleotidyltransferase
MMISGMSSYLMGQWALAVRDCDAAERILLERCTGVLWELTNARRFALSSLTFMGDLVELGKRAPKLLTEARERGHLYAETDLRTRLMTFTWLAPGKPELAEANADGSAVFTRGETQGILVCTLGTSEDEQLIDSLKPRYNERFLLHYNFPGFSVGEVERRPGPGRREIGHGALARRALMAVLPKQEDFPYVIRLVSEITESNGSSSMASVCGGSMAMMAAGVPISAPVAGIAMGLVKEGDRYAVLTDILGDEDHYGDMDFKVCGTEVGITALQMDIKIAGISAELMGKALEQARQGRLHILGKMNESIATSRGHLSPYAPQIVQVQIDPELIGKIIGKGGETIRRIQEETGAKINIDDDGIITIASPDSASIEKAKSWISDLTELPEVGKIYSGPIKAIKDFGAFVEFIPGTEGLVHISEWDWSHITNLGDVAKEGDVVTIKLIEVDPRTGKFRLSRKALIVETEEAKALRAQRSAQREAQGGDDRGPRRDGGGDRGPRRDYGDRGPRREGQGRG